MAYPLGSSITITGTFTNASGANADPTTVTLYLQQPGQVDSTQHVTDVVRDATGVYHYNLTLNKAGTWTYGWVGTGAVQAATFDIPLVVASSALHT